MYNMAFGASGERGILLFLPMVVGGVVGGAMTRTIGGAVVGGIIGGAISVGSAVALFGGQ
jgi:hypothetical protein